jgi:PAS domain S-box-containing protein
VLPDRDWAAGAQADNHPTPTSQLPGAVFCLRLEPDGSERITGMSPGCAALWGVENAQIEQDASRLWALLGPNDLANFRSALQRSAGSMQDWVQEWCIQTPSGSRKWVHARGRPAKTGNGGTVWHTMAMDTTQSRRAEASIRDTGERFRQLLDRVSNVSVQGYARDMTTRYWNKASERLYGYTAEEAIGQNLLDLIIPTPMHSAVTGAVTTMMATGQSIPEGDLRLRRKDGSPIAVFSSHAYVEIPGSEPEFYCIDFDLTERQEAESLRTLLESQLRESQKMEALGTLAGGVAHDFNNIVAAILGNVELALSDIEEQSPARTSLLEIRKASRRARELVKQILAFSRRQTLERKPMRLEKIVDESMRLVKATLPPGIELRVACEADTPRALADATQIEQVLLNLCTNAWQCMPSGRAGTITVTLESYAGVPPNTNVSTLAHLGLGDQTAWVCLSVGDDGEGMSEETRKRIFEPFFTTKEPGKGTGLGLSVVHGILRDHQAVLDVQSALGEGTTFAMYFPVDSAHHASQVSTPAALMTDFGDFEGLENNHPPENAEKEDAPIHILYLDDDELITFLMKRLLEKKRYRVSVFVDAREALNAFAETPEQFDLVISDYNMPGMSGVDFARAVKALSINTPVAITSVDLNDSLRAEAPAAGVTELIYKPNSVEELFAAVDRLAQSITNRRPPL